MTVLPVTAQRRFRVRALALLAATILAVDVGVVLTSDGTDRPAIAGWDPRVLPMVEFVEKARGLRFKRAVPVSFLDEVEFEKKVATPPAESAEDKADLEQFVGELRALGLVRGAIDIERAYDDLTGASIIGLYVPDEKAAFVRGTELTPAVRVTLVHELTHVLQDQHFDLEAMRDDAPGGDTTAVTALIEGDATRVERAYEKDLSVSDRKSYQEEQLRGFRAAEAATSDVPAVLSDFLGFPYVFGPVLLNTLLEDDGNAGVDRAFRDPPTSEAQVVDPIAYPLAVDPVRVPTPAVPAGATALDDPGPFGQVFLFEVLGSQLGYEEAWNAVQGWRGDQFVGYRQGGVACAAADIAMADPGTADRLDRTARRWAARVPGATVSTRGSLVSLRSCDPGSSGTPLPKREPSAFDVLVVRTQILGELTSSGSAYLVGRCVADAVVADGRSSGYRDLTSEDPGAEAIKRFQAVAAAAVTRCSSKDG